jgi:hypothetical protein
VLELRRFRLDLSGGYANSDIIPTFSEGDRVVIALYRSPRGYYKMLGLYNGIYYVDGDIVRGLGSNTTTWRAEEGRARPQSRRAWKKRPSLRGRGGSLSQTVS